MRIIAIDPGYERVGIAIIEKPEKGREVLLYSDCFKTPATLPFYDRVSLIAEEVNKQITAYSPLAMAIETLFFNSNQKTAMYVSEARGIIVHQACVKKLAIFEYTPLQIKIAITGYGRGDKDQVTKMVPKLISINKTIKYDDEYDAIAVGLTCFASDTPKIQLLNK